MNSSPIDRRTSAKGFTLVEMMVSTGLVGAIGLVAFSIMTSTLKLSAQNVVTNVSNYRSRQTLDRLGEIVRFAQETPVLITNTGATASGSTADGIMVKNALGGPYVFKNTNGQSDADIPQGATAFQVEYAPGAGVAVPKVGDFFLINLSTQPQLEVTSVGAPVGSPVAKVQITTKTGLTEIAKPSVYTVNASRYRKEAYVFVQSGSQWDLRHYGRVTSSTNFSTASSYQVLGQGFQKLGNQAWFTTTTADGTQSSWLRAIARSSNHAEYAETSRNGRTTLTSMPLQVKLWNYNAPPPATP